MGAAESSVTAFFGKLADTWNTNDGTAFAAFSLRTDRLSIRLVSEPTAGLP